MIEPSSVQVLFADLQTEIVARSKTTPPQALTQSAVVLAKLAKLFALPIHLSVVPEGDRPPKLQPELAAELTGVTQRLRASADPFLEAETRDAIAAAGRRTLVVSGFATEVVVLRAVESAIAAGHTVYVPVDACGGMSARTEDAAFRRIDALGAQTTSVVSLATAMAPDFTTTLGKQMFAIVQELRLQ